MRFTMAVALLALSSACGAAPSDFQKHWSDGRAEMNGYRLKQPRYGAVREGRAALIYVTEDMSDTLRVKADPGKHPAADVYPVLKLNEDRHFQTGVYGYSVLTSTFVRPAPGWPVAKVSFSAQEWCGHVYHQLLVRGDRIEGTRHSYFDGEADATDRLAHPAGGLMEDALPILLRGWGFFSMKPGEARAVPFLRSLMSARFDHRPLAWGKATLERRAAAGSVAVPAGRFATTTYAVAIDGGPTVTYEIEAAHPFRLVRWSSTTGEEAELLGSTRLAYWKHNDPAGERFLPEMGFPVPSGSSVVK